MGDFSGEFPAIPVLLNGELDKKLDIVFFPDRDEYTSPTDPNFVEDVALLIGGGLSTIPWFLEFQDTFNFWLAREFANSGPDPDDDDASDGISCLREAPDKFRKTFSFADSAGIVHRSSCRDNAGSPGAFTIEVDLNRLQVVAHEMGHRPFGLSDEYCCDGGYFTRNIFAPPYPNMFKREAGCRNKGDNRGYDPDACRSLVDVDTDKDWWLFEPDYNAIDPEPPDLMQQAGCASFDSRAACERIEPALTGSGNDPNGNVACPFPLTTYRGDQDGVPDSGDETHWLCRRAGAAADAIWGRIDPGGGAPFFDRIDVGNSEEDRMRWMADECAAGRC
ncbi:MAG: hypothetical protein U5K56_04170 [Halioglobus sp.]|nr:hypothetical protein [Halioglobus sp.]